MKEIKDEVYRQAEIRGWYAPDVWYVVEEAIKADRETHALALEEIKNQYVTNDPQDSTSYGHGAYEALQQAADHLRAQKINT